MIVYYCFLAGGPESSNIYLLDRTFRPLAILSGHEDCVFSVKFINSNTIISASRDSSIRVWKLPSVFQFNKKIDPFSCYFVHSNDKVRCLDICRDVECTFNL